MSNTINTTNITYITNNTKDNIKIYLTNRTYIVNTNSNTKITLHLVSQQSVYTLYALSSLFKHGNKVEITSYLYLSTSHLCFPL